MTSRRRVDPGPVLVEPLSPSDGAARRRIDPGPVEAEAVAVASADTRRRIDPGPVEAEPVAVATEQSPARRRIDPAPVTVEGAAPTPAPSPQPLSRPERSPLRTLHDVAAGVDTDAVSAPDNAALYHVVEVVARRHGADHRTLEPDADGEGLRVGLGRFSQAAGELGAVLQLALARDPDAVRSHFGPVTDELLTVTTAPARAERLAPVAGTRLWEGEWPARFRAAADIPSYRYAQNEQAVEHQVKPLVPVVQALGGEDGRALAIAYDRALTHGVGGAVEWLLDSLAATLDDERALATLRTDWRRLRQETAWLPDGDDGDAVARAALVGGLRAAGRAQPTDVLARLREAASDPTRAASLSADPSLHAITLAGPGLP